jgi:Leucine-rich repeat (LRR) protein
MFGMNELLESIPETTTLFEVDNTSNDKVIFDIPDSIGRLVNLQTLVFNNCINKLPETIGNLSNLQFLTLTNNEELTTFPDSVVDLKCLLFISVENSPIDVETLPEEFKRYVDTDTETFWPVNYPDEMRGDCLL